LNFFRKIAIILFCNIIWAGVVAPGFIPAAVNPTFKEMGAYHFWGNSHQVTVTGRRLSGIEKLFGQ
jgi:hypothetical protein